MDAKNRLSASPLRQSCRRHNASHPRAVQISAIRSCIGIFQRAAGSICRRTCSRISSGKTITPQWRVVKDAEQFAARRFVAPREGVAAHIAKGKDAFKNLLLVHWEPPSFTVTQARGIEPDRES